MEARRAYTCHFYIEQVRASQVPLTVAAVAGEVFTDARRIDGRSQWSTIDAFHSVLLIALYHYKERFFYWLLGSLLIGSRLPTSLPN